MTRRIAFLVLLTLAFAALRASASRSGSDPSSRWLLAPGDAASGIVQTQSGTPPTALDGPPAASSPSVAASAVIPPRASTVPPATSSALVGEATWYDNGPGLYAAMPDHRWHHTTHAVVCAFPGGRSACETLPVIDFCACGGKHVIDLSPAAFRALGSPLSRGVILVRVTELP